MTKKDYQAFARTIHRHKAFFQMNAAHGQASEVFERLIYMIGDVFAEDNDRFDYERFTEACRTGKCKGMKS